MIMLIDEFGSKMGNMSYVEAKDIADNKKLDLILVNEDKDIYKLGDFGKIKYDKKQKIKKNRSNKRSNKTKEIQLRPTIDVGDLNIKIRKIKGFLSSGFKTKLVMKFKKRQVVYKNIGIQKIEDTLNELINDKLIADKGSYKIDGAQITVLLTPLEK